MLKKKTIAILVLALGCFVTNASAGDTIRVNRGMLETAELKAGVNHYFVYIKMDKDKPSSYQHIWTRKVTRTLLNNRPVINIYQSWEDQDSVLHTASSINDAATMEPLQHQFWWKNTGTVDVDFVQKRVRENAKEISQKDTAAATRKRWNAFVTAKDSFCLNWHLDLEIFPLLPFREGVVFEIPFYDPGTTAPLTKSHYTVAGSETLETFDNWKVDCWVLTHTEKGNQEKFWISKRTREVIKMEQLINDKIYRYKIKLDYKG